jgi:hypothetical protein
MITFDAIVGEIEEDTSYEVDIKGIISTTVTDCGDINDSVVSFESALSSCVELMLSDDYELELVKKCRINGRRYRKYVVSIDNGD